MFGIFNIRSNTGHTKGQISGKTLILSLPVPELYDVEELPDDWHAVLQDGKEELEQLCIM